MSVRPIVVLVALIASAGCSDPPPAQVAAEGYERDVKPFLGKWCADCHSGAEPEGGLDLTTVSPAPGDADASDKWRIAKRKLRRRQMPPADEPQPSADEVGRVMKWFDARDAAAPKTPADPARTTLRRLSRFEYQRTVKDLLGVEFDADARLPANDASYGFDDIGDAMSMPPALLEKYLAAAEEVASLAIIEPDSKFPLVRRFKPESGRFEFTARGSAGADVLLLREGDYVMRARAWAVQAGSEPTRMAFQAEGATDVVAEVKGTEAAPEVHEGKVHLAAGTRHVAVAFVNDFVNPNEPNPTGNTQRRLYVEWMEFVGPVDVRQVSEVQRRLFGDDPARPRDRAFTREVVRKLADRAFRRPATDTEIDGFADLVDLSLRGGTTFERGVQLALAAILVSPHFLYRIETDPSPEDTKAAHDLTDWELATRLSYFVWSSMPDDELLALAAKGALRDETTLVAQTNRLLADARSSALVSNFARQWLELARLDVAAPDPVRFPQFDDALRVSMRRETEMFVEAVIRERMPLRTLISSDFTFVDERLARHYGIEGVGGDEFRRVTLPPGRRGGLLTQASILTLTSNPTRTAPVKRGKFILDEILGEPPPPPPPGVGTLDESDEAVRTLSLRERMAKHRADPKCFPCHARMDSLGMALEHFDPLGVWRERDEAHPIDALGTFADGRKFDGAIALRDLLVGDDSLAYCLAERLTIYAIGRGPTREDRAAADRLVGELPGLDATFADLVVGVVKMEGFRRRRGEAR